jgi:purine-binding chemotaxis protein CheW
MTDHSMQSKGVQLAKDDDEKGGDGIQWVLFTLGDEEYAVSATQVQEIVRSAGITLVPNMPDFVKGICNLRGKIVPILDLKERFAIEGQTDAVKARIIVAHVETQMVGFTVDSVTGVLRIPPNKIEGVPANLPKVDVDYILGVAKIENRLILLLNVDKMLKNMEKLILESAPWDKK